MTCPVVGPWGCRCLRKNWDETGSCQMLLVTIWIVVASDTYLPYPRYFAIEQL